MKTFRVRVYVNGSSPLVIQGGVDPLGVYLETREASGEGDMAIPAKRIDIDPSRLRKLSETSDADFEFLDALPSKAFES